MSLLMALPVALQAQEPAGEGKAPARNTSSAKYEKRPIAGQVVDAVTGKPVSGAIVRAQGIDGFSTLTNDEGMYNLNLPTFVSSILVKSPDHNTLVMGLADGEQQKNARLISNVFAADYTDQVDVLGNPVANVSEYTSAINLKDDIQKSIGAYVHTISRGGTPGLGSVMFIQGLNSLNSNAQPLVVIDGVILEQQYDRTVLHEGLANDILSNINPEDIESVEVLRNGTALYGARGANGVINIRTHRCTSMTTRITARDRKSVV